MNFWNITEFHSSAGTCPFVTKLRIRKLVSILGMKLMISYNYEEQTTVNCILQAIPSQLFDTAETKKSSCF
jgi:hypothetical protein